VRPGFFQFGVDTLFTIEHKFGKIEVKIQFLPMVVESSV